MSRSDIVGVILIFLYSRNWILLHVRTVNIQYPSHEARGE